MSDHAASPHAFSADARAALYEIMRKRRDIREFAEGAVVPEDVLQRMLEAAHMAPSVGFSQPWGFVLVRDEARRARIRESFLRCRQAEAARFAEPRRTQYLGYRLEGIAQSSLNLCVTVDLRGDGEHVLGTTAQPDAVRASVLCAVQNLWLAARAEGIAVGWVSIVEPEILRTELGLPAGVEAVAYLCVGLPKEPFRERPLLEETAWRDRVNLAERVHREQWPANAPTRDSQAAPAAAEASSVEISEGARRASALQQATLVKPEGSLGKLETLAGWVAAAHGVFPAVATGPLRTGLVVFAADHGVVAEGVSAYGSTLTAQMLATMAQGGAAINVLAEAEEMSLTLVDVGVRGALDGVPAGAKNVVHNARIRPGTGNLRSEPAMRRDQAEQALAVGARYARAMVDCAVLGVGEVGIGNTTSAAAMVCALTGAPVDLVVGRGTGIDDATLQRKRAVVAAGLERAGFRPSHPEPDALRVLTEVGGLELGAMAGFLLEAARCRRPVVLDGFLSSAAALLACALGGPNVVHFWTASHQSAEAGAAIALASLGLEPLLSLGLRLGEGTGAVLGVGLVKRALLLERRMATRQTAGLRDRT